MLEFRFRVHSSGWKDGGYENANFAPTEKRVHAIIKHWNEEADKRNAHLASIGMPPRDPMDGHVTLLEIIPLTPEQFAEDYIA